MGIHASWDNEEKTVIHSVDDGEWDWKDAYAITQQINEMIESVNHKVDLIIGDDTRRMGKIPPNAVTHWHTAYRSLHPNVGLIVIVGANSFVRALVNVLIKITHSNSQIRMVSTLTEAHTLVTPLETLSKSA